MRRADAHGTRTTILASMARGSVSRRSGGWCFRLDAGVGAVTGCRRPIPCPARRSSDLARSANELNDPGYDKEHAEDDHHDVPYLGAWIVDQAPGDAVSLYPPERSKSQRGVDHTDPD